MSSFNLTPELLIGGSSDLDAVFLPLNIETTLTSDTNSSAATTSWTGGSMGEHHHRHNHHHSHSNHVGSGISNFVDGSTGNGKGGGCPESKILLETIDEDYDDEDNKETGSSKLVHAIITKQPSSKDWCYRTSLLSACIIVVVLLVVIFGFDYVCRLLLWMEGLETWQGILVMAALFCVIAFPMAWGLSLLMVVCGYLYGILYGPLVVALCITICLIVSRTVMKSLCAESLRARFYTPRVEAIVNVVSGKHGMKIVALTRLTPIPFGLQNALFSLSTMSLSRYVISSVGGFVPMNLLHCYLGSTLRTMQDLMSYDSNHLVGYLIFGGQILITVILLWFVVRKARMELKKAMDQSDKSSPELLLNGDCSKTVFVDGDNGL